ncbi:hypothetical protein CYMTET_4513 [Cymbomonas tetramitiformis]|uniref:Reverse transcriptase domain-containing protein n=1 Tax=Cymbomonas tetramitiformis TaxID=36881 RepID=A0AAE0H120_9CHLO|nr:hypothetical protein CYMTET_4513 [Cymbomonas tetramitiformis]
MSTEAARIEHWRAAGLRAELQRLREAMASSQTLSKARCSEVKKAASDWVKQYQQDLQLLPQVVQEHTDRLVAAGLLERTATGGVGVLEWRLVAAGLWGTQRAGERALLQEVIAWADSLLGLPQPAAKMTAEEMTRIAREAADAAVAGVRSTVDELSAFVRSHLAGSGAGGSAGGGSSGQPPHPLEVEFGAALVNSIATSCDWTQEQCVRACGQLIQEAAGLRAGLSALRDKHDFGKSPMRELEPHRFPLLVHRHPRLASEECDLDELPAGEEASIESWRVRVHTLRARVAGYQAFVKLHRPAVLISDVMKNEFFKKRKRVTFDDVDEDEAARRPAGGRGTDQLPVLDAARRAQLAEMGAPCCTVSDDTLARALRGELAPEDITRPPGEPQFLAGLVSKGPLQGVNLLVTAPRRLQPLEEGRISWGEHGGFTVQPKAPKCKSMEEWARGFMNIICTAPETERETMLDFLEWGKTIHAEFGFHHFTEFYEHLEGQQWITGAMGAKAAGAEKAKGVKGKGGKGGKGSEVAPGGCELHTSGDGQISTGLISELAEIGEDERLDGPVGELPLLGLDDGETADEVAVMGVLPWWDGLHTEDYVRVWDVQGGPWGHGIEPALQSVEKLVPVPVSVANPELWRAHSQDARVRSSSRWPALRQELAARATVETMESCGTMEAERRCYEEEIEKVGCVVPLLTRRAHCVAAAFQEWHAVQFLVRSAACGTGWAYEDVELDEPYRVPNYVGPEHAEVMRGVIAEEMQAGRIFLAGWRLPVGVIAMGMVEKVRKGKVKFRPVSDYSRPKVGGVNARIALDSDEFSTVKEAFALLRPGYFMVKVDLENAYRSLGIASQYWSSQCFEYDGIRYMDTRAPFGNRALPGIFMRFTRAIVAWMQAQGVQCVGYLDDFFCVGRTAAEAEENMMLLVEFVSFLGFSVNMAKCEGPARRMEFLGILLSTDGEVCTAAIDQSRIQNVLTRANLLRAQAARGKVRRRALESLMGLLAFCSQVVWGLSLYTRRGFAFLAATVSRKTVRLAAPVLEDLAVLERVLRMYNGRQVVLHRRVVDESHFATDASGTLGFGGVWEKLFFLLSWADLARMPQRAWFPRQPGVQETWSINYMELFAVWWAVAIWGHRMQGTTVVVNVDNQSALFQIKRWWGPVAYLPLLRQLFYACSKHDIRLQPVYISSEDNLLADLLSRLQLARFETEHRAFLRATVWRQDRDDWMLGPVQWSDIDLEFGPFTVDCCVAPSRANSYCYRSWSKEEDARIQKFDGLNAWGNLPFSILKEILVNFLRAKKRQQWGTAACFLVPVWPGNPGWDMVASMPEVFKPVSSDREERRKRRAENQRLSQFFKTDDEEQHLGGGGHLSEGEESILEEMDEESEAEPLVIWDSDEDIMDDSHSHSSGSLRRPNFWYTGGKDEDRGQFIRKLVAWVGEFERAHTAKLRSKLKSVQMAGLTDAQREKIRKQQPDWRTLWEALPWLLMNDKEESIESVAYSYFMEAFELDGIMACRMDRVLKDTRQHGHMRGVVIYGKAPFHEMESGTTWCVSRPVIQGDAEGEVSDEYLTVGISLKGLIGTDGTEDTQYYWALRAFVAELEEKFLMKGTQEKKELLVSQPQAAHQDGISFLKSCQRRQLQQHAGKAEATWEELRQAIEECINLLRIKVFKTRVAEQARAQHPPPGKITWKDLELIVGVQDKMKNDAESWILRFMQEITRRAGDVYACWEAKQNGIDLVALCNTIKTFAAAKALRETELAAGKTPAQDAQVEAATSTPTKKTKREVNQAEQQSKRGKDYSNTPPPSPSGRKEEGKVQGYKDCVGCYMGGKHADNQRQCWVSSKDANVPEGFHQGRLKSPHWKERENARMRMYNIMFRFPTSDWGITVADWKKLTEDQKNSAVQKGKGAGQQASLAEEYAGMQAQVLSAPSSRAPSTNGSTQHFSDDDDEQTLTVKVAERPVYIMDVEANCAGQPEGLGEALPARHLPTLAHIKNVRVEKKQKEAMVNRAGDGNASSSTPEEVRCAAPAVALGSTQKMTGFPVKTAEEFSKEARVPLAPPADSLARKCYLLAHCLKSGRTALNHIMATLSVEGRLPPPNQIETLLALDGQEQLPSALAAAGADLTESDDDLTGDEEGDDAPELSDGDDDDGDDVALEEMPPGVVEVHHAGRPLARSAQMGEQRRCTEHEGAQVSEVTGQVEAGTMAANVYSQLKERMSRNVSDELLTDMAQVQPVCKLLNRTLEEGMALISAWGVLMLYRAILYDTGANCNIIPIRRVLELGLAIYDVASSGRVTRCDGTPTEFSKYCYVEVVLAAGTPHMTLHRLHAFISYAANTTWDFLVGTGPLKNALRITLDLYRGTAISEAPLLLGMKQKVILPLIELKAPAAGARKRNRDPRVCLASEILDRNATQTHIIADLEKESDEGIVWQVNVGERPLFEEGERTHCPDLSQEERARSRKAYKQKSRGPWPGSMCHPWEVNPHDFQEPPGSWAEQRLALDRHGWARLCRLVSAEDNPSHYDQPGPDMTLVSFQRCRQLRWIANKDLHWPDFTQQLQNALVHVQKLPSGLMMGSLMWDTEMCTFAVLPNSTSNTMDIVIAALKRVGVDDDGIREALGDIQIPVYYEENSQYRYQCFKYLDAVDLITLRAELQLEWEAVRQGTRDAPALILVRPTTKRNGKCYPVTDGGGGPGVVYRDHRAAYEHLGLDVGSEMLGAQTNLSQAYQVLEDHSKRRDPARPRGEQGTMRNPAPPLLAQHQQRPRDRQEPDVGYGGKASAVVSDEDFIRPHLARTLRNDAIYEGSKRGARCLASAWRRRWQNGKEEREDTVTTAFTAHSA